MTDPDRITPRTTTESLPTGTWHTTIPALTIQILDLPLK
jgi:hypothetical protein